MLHILLVLFEAVVMTIAVCAPFLAPIYVLLWGIDQFFDDKNKN